MAKESNWSAGEKVPRTGTYKCIYCGPDGMGASVLKHAMKSMGIPYTPPASAQKKPPLKFFKEGDSFPSCPNCKNDPSGADTTGWDFVSEKAVATKPRAAASKPDMVYFECTRPSGDGTCSDDSCPCGYPGANIPRGSGYFYISKELVEMRRDALTLDAIQKKVMSMQQNMGATMMTATSGVFMPILMCAQGAKKRGLDLAVAAADAKYWWETGLAPLRPTPMAGSGARQSTPNQASDATSEPATASSANQALSTNKPTPDAPIPLELVKATLAGGVELTHRETLWFFCGTKDIPVKWYWTNSRIIRELRKAPRTGEEHWL